MKRFLFLALALFTIHCSLFTLDASAQSRTNRIYRNCPGTTTKAAVAIDVAGNITVTPCSGKTVITNGVKVYRAILTQTGAAAPTATVLENSLGGTLVWTRTGVGAYTGTLAGAFPTNLKVFTDLRAGRFYLNGGDATQIATLSVGSNDAVNLATFDTLTGSINNNAEMESIAFPITIVIYP